MKIEREDIRTFTYEGTDAMINFKSDKLPKVPKDFKATVKLKNGKEVTAPKEYRDQIWHWWYLFRKDELSRNLLHQVANDMLSPNNPMKRKR